jgi:hypothetical protein
MIKKQNLFKLAAIITAIVLIAIIGVGVTSCAGPEGPMGPPGIDGKDGTGGKDGTDGSDGTGNNGQDGQDGQDGKDGIPGADVTFFTVTFDTGEGGSKIDPRLIAKGTATTRPENIPTRSFEMDVLPAGLYRAGIGGWQFAGWFLDDILYNFDTAVTSSITLTAGWQSPGVVSTGVDGINAVPSASNFVEKVVDYVNKEPGGYLLYIDQDYTVGTEQALTGSNKQLSIRGKGAERTITVGTTNGLLFTVEDGATLVLDDKIKIQGKATASSHLVGVTSGGKFYMETGSKITGHKTSSANGAVYVHGMNTSQFYLRGGEISGNESTAVTGDVTGAIKIEAGTFYLQGGTISGNKASGSSGTSAGAISITGGNLSSGSEVFLPTSITGNSVDASASTGLSGGAVYNGASFSLGNVNAPLGVITATGNSVTGGVGKSAGFFMGDSHITSGGTSFVIFFATVTGNEVTGGGGLSAGGFYFTENLNFLLAGNRQFIGDTVTGNTGKMGDIFIENNTADTKIGIANMTVVGTITYGVVNFPLVCGYPSASIEVLNLYNNNNIVNTVNAWEDKEVIRGLSTLLSFTAEVLAKVGTINFMTSNLTTTPITEFGYIDIVQRSSFVFFPFDNAVGAGIFRVQK